MTTTKTDAQITQAAVSAYDAIVSHAVAGTLTAAKLDEILDAAEAAGVQPVAHDPATLGGSALLLGGRALGLLAGGAR